MLAAILPATTPPVAESLQPSGRWNIEYADSMCLLSREYGTDAQKRTLGFRSIPLSLSTDIVLITTNAAGQPSDALGKGMLTIAPSGLTIAVDYKIQRPTSSPDSRVMIMTILSADFEDVTKSDAITIATRNIPSMKLALKGNIKAVAALKSCNDDLLREWKIDPAESDLVAEAPHANPGSWISNDDYPAAAQGAQGKVTAVFKIGVDGLISDCRVLISSGTAILDTVACKLIVERGHYTPATGKDGKPMAVHRTLSFTFMHS